MNRAEVIAAHLLEADPPTDPKDIINQVMPTKTLRLGGNDFLNAPAMVNLAIREFNLGGGRNMKGRKWARGLLSAWRLDAETIEKILADPRTTVEADGDHAVVTIHTYAQPPRNRKSIQRPPAE